MRKAEEPLLCTTEMVMLCKSREAANIIPHEREAAGYGNVRSKGKEEPMQQVFSITAHGEKPRGTTWLTFSRWTDCDGIKCFC